MSTFRYGKPHPSSCIDHIFLSCRVWWSFQSPECFATLTDVLFSEAQLFRPRTFNGEVATGWIRATRGSRWGLRRALEEESEGSRVLVKHYVTALTRKWNAQHQSGGGPRSKPAPHSPIWFCLTSALLFPSLLFFSASQSHFSSFLRAGLLFFPRQKFLHVTEATTW